MKIYIYWIACLLCFAGCGDFLDETLKGTLIPKTVDDFAMMLDSYDSHADKIAYGNCLTDAMDDDVQIPEAKISRYRNWGIRSFWFWMNPSTDWIPAAYGKWNSCLPN